jgi:hypothetical protein
MSIYYKVYQLTEEVKQNIEILNENRPYTYLVGWSKLDRFYYGVRYSAEAKPVDLFEIYFTSSKHVKKFIKDNGPPDIIEIRKIFDNTHDARDWENKVLKKMKVVHSDRWINKTDNASISPDCTHEWSEESRKKASLSRIGRKNSAETRQKLSEKLRGRDTYWLKGKKRPDHSEKMSGSNSPTAISVEYNGIKYGTIKEMSNITDISYYLIKK